MSSSPFLSRGILIGGLVSASCVEPQRLTPDADAGDAADIAVPDAPDVVSPRDAMDTSLDLATMPDGARSDGAPADVSDASTDTLSEGSAPDAATCAGGTTRCGASEGCVDLSVDPAHCGRCGNACVAGRACRAGDCLAVTQVEGGDRHTCALLADRTVMCWGARDHGEVGDGSPRTVRGGVTRVLPQPTPTRALGLTDIREIAVGQAHTCALRGDGTVHCWGRATLYRPEWPAEDSSTPIMVRGLTGAVSISAGASHTCAALRAGTVYCWGSTFANLLGTGVVGTGIGEPVAILGIETATKVVAGHHHTCVLLADETVRCWGRFTPLGPTIALASPAPGVLRAVVRLVAGNGFTCALTRDGVVRCWGENSSGALGSGTTSAQLTPTVVPLGAPARDLAAGHDHACAETADGLFCWGANGKGQLGDGSYGPELALTPLRVLDGVAATAVGAGGEHTCATVAGVLRCWGDNLDGQLGDGLTVGQPTPQGVVGIAGAAQVTSKRWTTCARLLDGTASCWGVGSSGELGDGTRYRGRFSPGPVRGLTGIAEIASGWGHGCARSSDGTVRCWGSNLRGQVGDGTSATFVYAPVAVTGLRDVIGLALGSTTSCALLSNRSVRCWGDNRSGQLGLGLVDADPRPQPTDPVVGVTDAVAVTMGEEHACAVRADGTVVCWGRNHIGQLGDGTNLARREPVAALALTDVTQVEATGGFTCARRRDGTVSCWGINTFGQCGLATSPSPVLRPTPVAGLTEVEEIGVGGSSVCARRRDGSVWCWGSNDALQLGRAVRAAAGPTPLPVPGLTGVTAIIAGADHFCVRMADATLRCWGDYDEGQLGNGVLHTPAL